MNKKEILKSKIKEINLWDNSVSIFPGMWWHVMSLILEGQELFYQDMYKIDDLLTPWNKPKWGMPYMFPNAWPLSDLEQKKSSINLKQHWFWRLSEWGVIENTKDQIIQVLEFNKPEWYNYIWKVENKTKLLNNNSVYFEHNITNLWENIIPVSTWLHPYFRIPDWVEKKDIKFNFKWWENISNNVANWEWTLSFENPWKPLEIYIPKLWTIKIEVSEEYSKFWVWSLEWKNFVCVEPVMNNEWWIVKNPIKINPWEENSNHMKISFIKD